jgi:hypothetical protein
MIRKALFVIATLATTHPASANDSSAEVAVGGLVLKPSEEIALVSEDLFISSAEVRVSYSFVNETERDVDLLIAFPLPDLPGGGFTESDGGISDDWPTSLKFSTKVDGQPVKLSYVEAAIFNGEDITRKLAAEKIPVFATTDAFHARINALPASKRKALIAEGLIEESGSGKQPYWAAKWSARASVTRKQTFPAGATVQVEHRYTPVAGGSVGGALEPRFRKQNGVETDYTRELRAKYCLEDDWLASFDRAGRKRQTESGAFPYSETWLGYVLKSGANWKGPIRDFRLVVDKGNPESMVSFCARGVKKISPTRFEARYRDFEPSEDLNILIINWGGGG